jgi:hypothetical protein
MSVESSLNQIEIRKWRYICIAWLKKIRRKNEPVDNPATRWRLMLRPGLVTFRRKKQRGSKTVLFCLEKIAGRHQIHLLMQVFSGVYSFFLTIFDVNLSLTRLFQALDRISRYFKAKFSALTR